MEWEGRKGGTFTSAMRLRDADAGHKGRTAVGEAGGRTLSALFRTRSQRFAVISFPLRDSYGGNYNASKMKSHY